MNLEGFFGFKFNYFELVSSIIKFCKSVFLVSSLVLNVRVKVLVCKVGFLVKVNMLKKM